MEITWWFDMEWPHVIKKYVCKMKTLICWKSSNWSKIQTLKVKRNVASQFGISADQCWEWHSKDEAWIQKSWWLSWVNTPVVNNLLGPVTVHYREVLLYVIFIGCLLPVASCPTVSSSSAFSLFGVGASSFQSPRSPVLCFFYLYSFLLHIVSYNNAPPQLRSSYISVSTHFHVLITTSSSVSLSTWPNHPSLASLIF